MVDDSLAGTLQGIAPVSDEQQGPTQGFNYLGSVGFNPEMVQQSFLNNNLQSLSELFNQQRAMQEEQGRKPIGLNLKPDGTAVVTGDMQDILKGMQGAQNYQKLIEGFSNQLAARQAQTQAHPVPSLLAQLAANIAANDPHLPGWVRGAAVTSQQLNPTIQQLQGQQIGLAQTLAQLQQQQLGTTLKVRQDLREQEQLDLQKQIEARRAAEAPVKDFVKVQGEHLTAAAKGELDPATATASLVQAGLLKPENAPAYQAQLQGAVDRFTAIKDKASQQQFARDVTKAQIAAETQARTFAQQDAMFAKRMAFQSAETDKKLAAAEAKATEKTKTLGPVAAKQLSDLNAADQSLNEIEKMLKDEKFAALSGPIMGRINKANPYHSGDVQQVQTKLGLQVAQAIKATGAGARGFGPQERGFFEHLAEGITHTPEQNLRIVQAWREYLDQERKGLMVGFPDAAWDTKYATALGPRLSTPSPTLPAVPQGWKIERVK